MFYNNGRVTYGFFTYKLKQSENMEGTSAVAEQRPRVPPGHGEGGGAPDGKGRGGGGVAREETLSLYHQICGIRNGMIH